MVADISITINNNLVSSAFQLVEKIDIKYNFIRIFTSAHWMVAYIVYNDVFWVIMMIKNVINMLFMKERKNGCFL